MRWVFFGLLALNGVALAWHLQHRTPPAAPLESAAEPIPGDVNQLLLLGELEEDVLRRRAGGSAGAEQDESGPGEPAEPAPEAGTCFSVGPLRTDEEIESFRTWLADRDGEVEARPEERREVSLYWVYFPPFETRAAASQRVTEMRESGVEDIFVIPRGDMTNAVSLGVYSREASRDRRLAELRALGHEPSVVSRYRTTRATWLYARYEEPDLSLAEDFGAEFPESEARAEACGLPAA